MNRLLIIEDDPEFGAVLAGKFSQINWRVSRATGMEEVSEILAQNPSYSHCVLDLNLQNQNGLTLIPALVAHSPGCKIVILTGYASVHSGIEAIKLGAVYLLQKPSRIQDILEAFEHTPHPETVRIDSHSKPGMAGIEHEVIQRTLAENNFNVSKTADQLGLHRRTLQRKMKRRI
jgi:two-component system, response regulator RegA